MTSGSAVATGVAAAAVAAVPMFAGALFFQPMRAVAFGVVFAALVLGSTLALDAASQDWYRYYVFALAGRYPFDWAQVASFWARTQPGPSMKLKSTT